MNSPLRVLYVDDNPLDRELVRDALENTAPPFALTTTAGRDAFTAALAAERYDCILTDLMMPGYTGFDVLAQVRALHPGLPVVILTGTGSEELAVKAMKSGATDYILKTPKHILRLPMVLRAVVDNARLACEHDRALAELRLAAKVFEASADAIIVLDAERRVLAVNRRFTEAYGYPAEAVVGQPIAVFRASAHDDDYCQRIWTEIARSGGWQGELTSRRRDGSLLPEWGCVSTVRDAAGVPTHFVFTLTDISERKAAAEHIQRLIHYDALTNLPNRVLFLDRLEQTLIATRRSGRSAALILIDLDRFRSINDTLGNHAGDDVLVEVSRRLSAQVREGDTVARLSGNEFAVMLDSLGHESDVIHLAQGFLDAITRPLAIGAQTVSLTASAGISLFPKDGDSVAALIKSADAALLRAKQAGRNVFRFYSPAMDANAARRLKLESALRVALERGEFEVHYQPQVSLANGRLSGMEALLRWQSAELGAVSPAEFIPVAEETGLIVAIGEWVLRQACAQNKAWQDAGLPALTVAVNLSVRQFHQAGLARLVADVLAESGLQAQYLEVELTESAFMNDVEEAIGIVRQIRALGVHLSLDDFGTGYSSLAYISRLPFDKIKIDQAFVRDITDNPVNAAIAGATIAMARNLNLRVLAEGVETEAQMLFLRARQCEAMQGFLFSKAVPAAEFAALLAEGRTLPLPDADAAETDTLLLVDDEYGVLQALKRLFRTEGYRVLTAASPEAAFELLARQPVQVIVSDQRMPTMTGTEFLSRVRKLYPDTIRIVLSGYTDLQSITDAINRGAIYKFLTKPWEDRLLKEQVREAFRVSRGLARAPD